MADVTDLQQSEVVRIVDETESYVVKVSPEGELSVSNFANINFIDASKTITTTAQIAAVGGSNLSNRKTLIIFNEGPQEIRYGSNSGTVATVGLVIEKDETAVFSVGENIDVYLVTNSSTSTAIIQEFS